MSASASTGASTRLVQLGAEPHRRRARERGEPLDDLPDQRRERAALRMHQGAAPLGAGILEHVLHQMGKPPGLLHDHAERLAPLVFTDHPSQLERLGVEQNLGERGPELVRHAAGEVGAEPGQLLLPAELPERDHAETAREREQQEQDREPAPGLDQGQPRGDGRRKRRPGREPASGIGGRGAGVLAAGERAGVPEQPIVRRPHLERSQLGVRYPPGDRRREQRPARERPGEHRRERRAADHHPVGGERGIVGRESAVADRLDPIERHPVVPRSAAPGGSESLDGPHRPAQPLAQVRRGGRARGGHAPAPEVDLEDEPSGIGAFGTGGHQLERGGDRRRRRERVVGRGARASHHWGQGRRQQIVELFGSGDEQLVRRHGRVVAKRPLRGDSVRAGGPLGLEREQSGQEQGEREQDGRAEGRGGKGAEALGRR